MGTVLQGRGLRGRGKRAAYRPLAEINVTPFVDVMLVLLIVFMVTAPLLTVGVPVDLPKTQAQNISDPDDPLIISVDSGGDVFVQDVYARRFHAESAVLPDSRNSGAWRHRLRAGRWRQRRRQQLQRRGR